MRALDAEPHIPPGNVPVTPAMTQEELLGTFERTRASTVVDRMLNAIPRVKYSLAKTWGPADWQALEELAGTGSTSEATRQAVLEGIRQRGLKP